MTAPSEKQIAILKKYHKDIPGTIQEASQIISGLFGKKEEKTEAPKTDRFKEVRETVEEYVKLCKALGYPVEYFNLSTVWNTAMMRK